MTAPVIAPEERAPTTDLSAQRIRARRRYQVNVYGLRVLTAAVLLLLLLALLWLPRVGPTSMQKMCRELQIGQRRELAELTTRQRQLVLDRLAAHWRLSRLSSIE